MPTKSQLVLPPQSLARCIAGGVMRDTRMVTLSDTDRLNYFPASPLFSITLVFEGEIHLSDDITSLEVLRSLPPIPKCLCLAPRASPHMSWSPGPVMAMTLAFFPDAWLRLGGALDGRPPPDIMPALQLLQANPLETAWPKFWQAMTQVWAASDGAALSRDWRGSDRIKDWTYHVLAQLARSGAGRSLRSAQRRLHRWTGQNRKALEFYAKVEDLHRLSKQEPHASPAQLAADAGFADQSHMGRALKRATGFSPVQLNHMISTEESFWCYRLLGERF